MPGPLHGFRIIDLTSMLSGPWATMILADQGADVVKVEMPGSGDHTRSLANQRGDMSANFLNINRNKRSITINLKTERGRELLEQLTKTFVPESQLGSGLANPVCAKWLRNFSTSRSVVSATEVPGLKSRCMIPSFRQYPA
jgi:hypothetical protein